MTSPRFPVGATLSTALLVLLASACSKSPSTAQSAGTPTPVVRTGAASPAPALPAAGMPSSGSAVTPAPVVRPAAPASGTVVIPAPAAPIAVESFSDQAGAAWTAIKDYTFDQRTAFTAGANQMVAMLDRQVAELDAKRATFAATVDTKNWDFAMHDLRDSQAYFKSMVMEAAGASSDTWQQEKDKVEAAWQKAQTAFDTVKTTVTAP